MKYMTYLIVAGCAATASVPAAAQENRGGARVEATVGWENARAGAFGHGNGVTYGAEIGYDYAISSNLIGGYAFLEGASAKDCGSYSRTAGTTTSSGEGCIKAPRTFGIGARISVPVSKGALAYGKIGYVNSRIRSDLTQTVESITTINGTPGWIMTFEKEFHQYKNRSGFQVGAGTQVDLFQGVYVKLEYTYSDLGRLQHEDESYQLARHRVATGMGVRF